MRHRSKTSLCAWSIIFVCVAGTVLINHTWASNRTNTAPAINPKIANLAAQDVSGKLEVELITLRPEGFEPLQITRPGGPFVLLVDDRSGKEASSLRLQPLKGEQLRDISTDRKKSEWHELINLPPGAYVLSDALNPERRCQITLVQ